MFILRNVSVFGTVANQSKDGDMLLSPPAHHI